MDKLKADFMRRSDALMQRKEDKQEELLDFFSVPVPLRLLNDPEVQERIQFLTQAMVFQQFWQGLAKLPEILAKHNPALFDSIINELALDLLDSYQYTKDKEQLSTTLRLVTTAEAFIANKLGAFTVIWNFSWQLSNYVPIEVLEPFLKAYRPKESLAELSKAARYLRAVAHWEGLIKSNDYSESTDKLARELSSLSSLPHNSSFIKALLVPLQLPENRLIPHRDFDLRDLESQDMRILESCCAYYLLPYNIPASVSRRLLRTLWNLDWCIDADAMSEAIVEKVASLKEELIQPGQMLLKDLCFTMTRIFGFTYVIDFLHAVQFIDQAVADDLFEKLKESQAISMIAFGPQNWRYRFLVDWKPHPKGSNISYEEMDSIFSTTGSLLAAQELSQMEVDELQVELAEAKAKLAAHTRGGLASPQHPIPEHAKPITRKYGRNEKVNVRYLDGRLVEQVKFKKVEMDIEKGECWIEG